jgi:hypothetical protein
MEEKGGERGNGECMSPKQVMPDWNLEMPTELGHIFSLYISRSKES